MNVQRVTTNRRLAVFKNDYRLRMDLTVQTGDEFPLGHGHGEFELDEDGYLVMFLGEFTPHRVDPKNFDIADEVKVTTVETHRRVVR